MQVLERHVFTIYRVKEVGWCWGVGGGGDSPTHRSLFIVLKGGSPGAPRLLGQVAEALPDLQLGGHGGPLHHPRQLLPLLVHRAHLAAQAREHVLYALRLLAGGDLAVHAAVLGAPGRAVAAGQLPEVDEVALVGRYGHRKSLVLSHAAQARDEFLHAGPAGGVGEGEDEEEAVRPQDGVLA